MAWTTKQLAEAARVTSIYVRQEIRAGNIKCEKIGRDWLIDDEEAQRWLSEHRFTRRDYVQKISDESGK